MKNLFAIFSGIDSKIAGQAVAIVVITLMAIGSVFVFSASANLNFESDLLNLYKSVGLRQFVIFPIALLIMLAMSNVDYHLLEFRQDWKKSPITYLLIGAVILLVMVLIPGIGIEKNNARRWLEIPLGFGRLSFQPSEFAKWVVIFFVSAYCVRFGEKLNDFFKRFVPLCLIVGFVVGLVLLEDFGTSALIAMLTFLLLIISGINLFYVLTPIPFGIGAFLAAILTSVERKQRILAFLHPDQWTDSFNYQPQQSLIAIASGGLFGRGLGEGICKYGHLPEDTTDFIFAIIGEELGFAGCAFVILLFILFVIFGMIIVSRSKDSFGRLLSAGIVLAVAIQVCLNIGVVTVVLPTKGIPLPFVSSGGTSMVLSAIAIGLLLNIAKQSGNQGIQTKL